MQAFRETTEVGAESGRHSGPLQAVTPSAGGRPAKASDGRWPVRLVAPTLEPDALGLRAAAHLRKAPGHSRGPRQIASAATRARRGGGRCARGPAWPGARAGRGRPRPSWASRASAEITALRAVPAHELLPTAQALLASEGRLCGELRGSDPGLPLISLSAERNDDVGSLTFHAPGRESPGRRAASCDWALPANAATPVPRRASAPPSSTDLKLRCLSICSAPSNA